MRRHGEHEEAIQGPEEYCNKEILEAIISSLNNDEEMVLKNSTIPPFLANNMGYIVDAILSGRINNE